MATLTEAIKTVMNAMMPDIHTCIPGRIEKYDSEYKKADVKPLIKADFDDDNPVEYPVVSNVPVIMPGSKNFIINFPLNKGDTGLLLFSEKSMEKWLSLGGVTESGDKRMFDVSDGIFIPGLYPFVNPSFVNNNKDFEVNYKGTAVRIKDDGNIEIGETNFKKLVNEEFKSVFDNHRHNYVGFVGTGTPTPGFTTGPTFTSGTLSPPPPTAPSGAILPGLVITDNELTDKTKAE